MKRKPASVGCGAGAGIESTLAWGNSPASPCTGGHLSWVPFGPSPDADDVWNFLSTLLQFYARPCSIRKCWRSKRFHSTTHRYFAELSIYGVLEMIVEHHQAEIGGECLVEA